MFVVYVCWVKHEEKLGNNVDNDTLQIVAIYMHVCIHINVCIFIVNAQHFEIL